MMIPPGFSTGARPIRSKQIQEHYQSHHYSPIMLDEYLQRWRHWLTHSDTKQLTGLEDFVYGDYTQGTSQTFDQFVLRHAGQRRIAVLKGEFQYHTCIAKQLTCEIIDGPENLCQSQALIISLPFSDYGCIHPAFEEIMSQCVALGVPVCLDLAYWGIAKNLRIDLRRYPCIQEVTASLSKCFFTLENHRVGVRFSRSYLDDGVSMLNEVGMQNLHSMSLGVHFMHHFSSDWNWYTYQDLYRDVCQNSGLSPTNTVIFGTSTSDLYQQFNRGIVGNHRICISKYLTDLT